MSRNAQKKRPKATSRRPTARSGQASRARIVRRPAPVANNFSIRNNRARHVEVFTSTEPVSVIKIKSTYEAGTLLLNLLISPRFLPTPNLHAKALAWSNYRFKALSFDFISFFPTTAAGGVCYGITRDVDAEIGDIPGFVKSCESSANVALSSGRTRLSIDCSESYNKQRYFSTMSTTPDDFAQFRLLAVVSQKLANMTIVDPINIEVMMNYTVEFSGPVAPPFSGTKITGLVTDAESKATRTGLDIGMYQNGTILALNPIPLSHDTDCAALAIEGENIIAYPTIEAAWSGSWRGVAGTTFELAADTYAITVGARDVYHSPTMSTLTRRLENLEVQHINKRSTTGMNQEGFINVAVTPGQQQDVTGNRNDASEGATLSAPNTEKTTIGVPTA